MFGGNFHIGSQVNRYTNSTAHIPNLITLLVMTFQTAWLCYQWLHHADILLVINHLNRRKLLSARFKSLQCFRFPFIRLISLTDGVQTGDMTD